MIVCICVCSSEIKVDCIRVNAMPIKTVIDDHIQRLFDALLSSLRRSIQSDITEIETFITAALETLSQRPQTVEEIGEANGKHMEFTQKKKEVCQKFQFHTSCLDESERCQLIDYIANAVDSSQSDNSLL